MAEDPSPSPAAPSGRDGRGRGQGVDLAGGGRIRERRVMLGLTLRQLAEPLGITYQQLAKYERGVDRLPAGRLPQVAQALGVGVGHFFEDLDPGGGRERVEPAGARARRRMVLALVRNVAGIGDRRVRQAVCVLVRALAAPRTGAPADPQVERRRPPSGAQSGPIR
jgi:transcriptional regulator with XRE-family HTH domain